MPYGIAQCYLPLGTGDIRTFTPAKLVLNFATTEGYKAEFTELAAAAATLRGLLVHNDPAMSPVSRVR